ncbi:MAG: serine--tRNA ligase [Nanoarchaeota archaeon]|nr:serine--tRNA ligase [Nanoarchaeota archaeon]MBU1501496.1 serine--tRNA ligase [Nanoarchaeota archaeon]
MIDIKDLRLRPEIYKANAKKKGRDVSIVDEVLELDAKWRAIKLKADNLRSERNQISEAINAAKKSKDENAAVKLIKKAKEIPGKLKELEGEEKEAQELLGEKISGVPNIMSKRVPLGESEKDNKVEKIYGKPARVSFPVKSHAEIIENLGMADFDASARVAGTGFYYLEGDVALLNQALINYARDFMVKKGFRYVETPLMLKEEVIDRVTDLNDKENQIYMIKDEPLALIGTSEHSLIGRFVGQEIPSAALPVKHTSYSMCFRKEIGSHGLDEKGLFRTHQFNKIEMIVICRPEESEKFYEEMKGITIDIFKGLKIPIRVLKICSGDLGDLKYEQVDIEAYSPRKKAYFEVGSCSNLTDAQARKLGISTIIKNRRITPHTLNNTAIATSRALVAILENNQTKDGSVKIPAVLQKYMDGKKIIKKG